MNHTPAKVDTLAIMANRLRRTTYKKGEFILRLHEQTTTTTQFFVIDGYVKAGTISGAGDEAILVVYGPGDFFPVGWMVDRPMRGTFFQALSDCEIGTMPQSDFWQAIQDDSQLAVAVTQNTVRQLMIYAARITNLGLKYSRDRLAYRLLTIAGRFGVKQAETIVLPSITQQDLAATINVSRENVNRELTRFEKLGIISYNRSAIIIKDVAALRKALGEDVVVMFFDNHPETNEVRKTSE